MKVLILGGSGMVGHALIKNLSDKYEVFSILRQRTNLESTGFFKNILERNRCMFINDINQRSNLNDIIEENISRYFN